ncbi:tetraacyldisaccharide 4'-kinase [Deltaproteobacteria bacterium]|nr:tetraacyldisaccharide 4'-kinase [Deltaproteobacteria bacterium]
MKLPDWSNIHEERQFHGAVPPLALLSLLYGLGVRLRLVADKRRRKRELPGFVVSIGNLTVGGTGKTPATVMMTEWALDKGYNVAILSRGYGGSYKTKVFVVSDKGDIKAGPDKTGDEPYLLAKRLKGVPVIISKNRYLAGLMAYEKFGSVFFILDDGFQHLMLKRDLDLVLINASSPFGNGHLLPWGPLREPVKELKRADAVVFTRYSQSLEGYDEEGILSKSLRGKPIFRGDHIPEKIVFPLKGGIFDPEFLKGKHVAAFAGIARPEVFKETLIKLGVDLVSFRSFKDHHPFSNGDLKSLMDEKEKTGAEFLITTEKDWVRLEKIVPEYSDLAYLTIRFSLLSGQDEFFNMVRERVEKRLRL